MIALTADLTRDEQRTKAMAIIGVTIGATFALSMVGRSGAQTQALVCRASSRSPGVLALVGDGGGALGDPRSGAALWLPSAVTLPESPACSATRAGASQLRDLRAACSPDGVVRGGAVRAAQRGIAGGSHWQVYLPVMAGVVRA